jgi:hypothetical protein
LQILVRDVHDIDLGEIRPYKKGNVWKSIQIKEFKRLEKEYESYLEFKEVYIAPLRERHNLVVNSYYL